MKSSILARTGRARGTMILNLTLSETEKIANGAPIAEALSAKKLGAIQPYLKDPNYHFSVNRLKKGFLGKLQFALNDPDEEIAFPASIVRLIERSAHDEGITVNQFINIAIAEKIHGRN